jgi:2-(1,2-epoxy-1,2-dihydrophenyl)acetyl-CoA isomerase
MEHIIINIQNTVATVTLNRPDKFNSFNRVMAMELQEALDSLGKDRAVRVIVLTGAGKAFCAGQDLAEATSEAFPGFEKVVREHYNPIITQMRQLAKPILVAINGVAAGAGANIALAGDIVIAHEQASLIQAFSKIGLIPDSGGTYILPRLIGMQKASALMMLGDKVSAQEALQMGMIYKVFSAEEYEASVNGLAIQLSQMPTHGLALTKKLLNESANNSLQEQLEAECKHQVEAGKSYDYQEGVQAFLEKRTPQFKGE